MDKERKKKIALAKGKLLWNLIKDSPGMTALAKPLQSETPFEKLDFDHKVTIVTLLKGYEDGAKKIDESEVPEKAETGNGNGNGKGESEEQERQANGQANGIEGEAIEVEVIPPPGYTPPGA